MAENLWRALFDNSPVSMAEVDQDGLLTLVNLAICEGLGYQADDMVGRLITDFVHPDDHQDVMEGVSRMEGFPVLVPGREYRMLHADGTVWWADIRAAPLPTLDGGRQHVLLSCVDVAIRHHYETKMLTLIDHDAATGLLSRTAFDVELQALLSQARGEDPVGALVIVDIDQLKQINMSHGHHVGDQVIMDVAAALRQRLRETDPLARFGGDRFAVLLTNARADQAAVVASDLVQDVRNQVVVRTGGGIRQVTVSVGLTMIGIPSPTLDTVLDQAEAAVDASKEAGHNRWTLSPDEAATGSPPDHGPDTRRHMARLLDESRFVLLSQPIVDLHTSEVDRYELLLRIRDDDGTLLTPAALLGDADRAGRVGRIDRWVVSHAIEIVSNHSDPGGLLFEVNISGRSIGDPHLMAFIEKQVRSSSIDPQRLIFEISEKSAIANIGFAREFSHNLSRIGCRFALDNFGSGGGGFYILKHIPFDYLKIDGEFVVHCLTDLTDRLMIEGMVHIVQGLGKRTVAEFVQDQPTLDYLKAQGVDYAQGFYVGKPSFLGAGGA